jgi:hydantoinase/carbamoylase family amidase
MRSPTGLDPTIAPAAARVDQRLRELAACSESATGLTRRFATPAMMQAHALLADWMTAAGMTPRVDAACNLIGRSARFEPASGPRSPVLLIGSHIDTVPDAGRFDGALGVVLGIEAVAELARRGESLPFAVEVVAFSDEEGVRFRTPYLGSRALAGDFPPDLLELRDDDGTTLRQAIAAFGQDPDRIDACRVATPCLGYLEVHIEQGPQLERAGEPLGVVTAIAGQTRAALRFVGEAGHAGTVPMAGRRDALAGAAEWIAFVESLARELPGLVATVGSLEVTPNARNVIPGEVAASLDLRHGLDAERERAADAALDRARAIAERRGLGLRVERLEHQSAAPCDVELRSSFEAACDRHGLAPLRLVSGAGHDAVPMARLTRVAMLFVRCRGGLSHHPDEHVEVGDLACALAVLVDTIAGLARALNATGDATAPSRKEAAST